MIEAIGLTKRYGDVVAVDDLTFQVKPGQVTGFLGPNGAGKSTTMRMMLGLDRPSSGKVLINGKSYRELHRPLTQVGALLEARWVHPNRSARAHLQWMAATNNLPTTRVDEALDLVGLAAVAKKRAGGFSLGMSQRLGIATALLGDPKILLFDEPVNGLDPEGIVWIRQFMQRLASEGRTVLVSSHLLSEMAQTAQDLIVIGRGKLIAQTSTQAFIEQASGTAVRVRSPQPDKLVQLLTDNDLSFDMVEQSFVVRATTTEHIGDLAAANGLGLHELAAERGSLEEAFMQLTGDSVQYHAEEIATPAQPADLISQGK